MDNKLEKYVKLNRMQNKVKKKTTDQNLTRKI